MRVTKDNKNDKNILINNKINNNNNENKINNKSNRIMMDFNRVLYYFMTKFPVFVGVR